MTVPGTEPQPAPLDPRPLVEAALAQAFAWDRVGRWDEAAALLRAARPATAGNPQLEAEVLLALLRMWNGQDFIQMPERADEKTAALDRLDAIAEELSDPLLRAAAMHERALDLHVRYFHGDGDVEREESLLREALALREEHGDANGAAWSLFYVGTVQQVMHGDADAAARSFEEAYARTEQLDDPVLTSYVVRHLGQLRQTGGDYDGALPWLEESLELRQRAGWYAGTLAAHHALGSLRRARGETELAREQLERAREVGERIGSRFMLRFVMDDLAGLPAEGEDAAQRGTRVNALGERKA